ncbi:diphosphoinositol-polyphosphate diphosphatase [Ranunculus cassubicifolius]
MARYGKPTVCSIIFLLDENSDGESKQVLEVLMINSTSGPGLLFPKSIFVSISSTSYLCDLRITFFNYPTLLSLACVLWQQFLGHYHFKSKTHQDEFSPEGLCKAAMFALFKSTRMRKWLTIPEAKENCRHAWMREVLEEGFCKWHDKITMGSE